MQKSNHNKVRGRRPQAESVDTPLVRLAWFVLKEQRFFHSHSAIQYFIVITAVSIACYFDLFYLGLLYLHYLIV